MGKRQTYRRRSRKRPTRQQRRKTQNRTSRRRQRGGVSDTIVTDKMVGGVPVAYNRTVVATTGGTMTLKEWEAREQQGGDLD